jgi:hypothetical protein
MRLFLIQKDTSVFALSKNVHNAGYNQFADAPNYSENLLKTYDTQKASVARNPEYGNRAFKLFGRQ